MKSAWIKTGEKVGLKLGVKLGSPPNVPKWFKKGYQLAHCPELIWATHVRVATHKDVSLFASNKFGWSLGSKLGKSGFEIMGLSGIPPANNRWGAKLLLGRNRFRRHACMARCTKSFFPFRREQICVELALFKREIKAGFKLWVKLGSNSYCRILQSVLPAGHVSLCFDFLRLTLPLSSPHFLVHRRVTCAADPPKCRLTGFTGFTKSAEPQFQGQRNGLGCCTGVCCAMSQRVWLASSARVAMSTAVVCILFWACPRPLVLDLDQAHAFKARQA